MRFPRFAVLLLAAGAALLPAAAPAQEELYKALAGPGERMLLKAARLPDGTGGVMTTETDENQKFLRFEAKGLVSIDSPKIKLRTRSLVYDGVSGLLLADGDVEIEQQGVQATAQKLRFVIESQQILLTGTPRVTQQNADGSTLFEGMEEFELRPGKDGVTEIFLRGGKEILTELIPAPKASGTTTTGTLTPPSAATPASATPASGGGGMGALGRKVRIQTRPRGNEAPNVFISARRDGGGMGLFRAEGSVTLESDSLSLLANRLEFDGASQMVEALYNVYVKQNTIEADCGRLLYDLINNRIELSVKPEIRESRPGGRVRIYDLASYIITRAPDGRVSTTTVPGPEGDPKIEYLGEPTPKVTPTPAPDTEQEIRLDRPEDLKRLRQ